MFYGVVGIGYIAFIIALVAAQWKIFEKAGRPGWEALIPFYNLYIMITKIIKKEAWWIFMFLIPIANIVFAIKILIALAKAFGKEGSFAFLFFIFGIGYFILGFGDARYILNDKDGDSDLLGRLDKNY